jgi:hypothetical protein
MNTRHSKKPPLGLKMPNVHCQKLLKIVAVSGRLHHPSKTEALLQAIIDELRDATVPLSPWLAP